MFPKIRDGTRREGDTTMKGYPSQHGPGGSNLGANGFQGSDIRVNAVQWTL